MRSSFLICFIFILNISSAYGQLSFGVYTIYFENEVIKKVSIGLDGNIWCIKGDGQRGIGLVNKIGLSADLSNFLTTVTNSSFTGIQGFDTNDAFIATSHDYLYKLRPMVFTSILARLPGLQKEDSIL